MLFFVTKKYKTLKQKTHMKSLLKNLGVILVIIGAVILIASYATGNVNNNTILGGSLALTIIGLITYIICNKRIVD